MQFMVLVMWWKETTQNVLLQNFSITILGQNKVDRISLL